MMKKMICIMITILISMTCFLIGCEKKTSTYIESDRGYSEDMQIMYLMSGGNGFVPMTKSETGYYYVGKSSQQKRIVFYIDKESRRATPLCSKPNCLHDDPNACDAYINITLNIKIDTMFGATGNAIQYYDGSLYMICGEYDKSYINYNTYLMRMDLDGGNRTKLTDFFDYTVSMWCIHRGYFYYLTDSSVLRVPMSNLKSEPEVVYKTDYYIEDAWGTFYGLHAYKNYLYFRINEKDIEGNGTGTHTICVNLDTSEKTEITINDHYAQIEGFVNDKLIISDIELSSRSKYYKTANLDGSEQKDYLTQDSETISTFTSDGRYCFFDNSVHVKPDEDIEQVITVTDSDLNVVDTFKLPPIDCITYNFFAPQDKDFFFFESVSKSGEYILVMADKSQIGSIGGEVIEYTELTKLKLADNSNNGFYVSE